MKRITTIATAILAGSLTMGIAGQASAMTASGLFSLDGGKTSARSVGGTDHYTLQVDSPTRVSIESQSFLPQDAPHINARAALLDDNGNVVAEAQRSGSNFEFDRVVQAGDYTLAVESWNSSAAENGPNMYFLRTQIDPAR